MNRRELGAGAAVVALVGGLASTATAQSRDPQQVAFYDGFNDSLARLPSDIQPDVRAFYEQNGWRPVWTDQRTQELRAAMMQAERHGLSYEDWLDFDSVVRDDPSAREMRTTWGALAYARILSEGRVHPEQVEDLWEMDKNRVDLPAGLNAAIGGNRLAQWYEELAPNDFGYNNLSDGYVRYRRLLAQGGWPAFRAGAAIAPGGTDSRIPVLVARLIAEGDLTGADATAARNAGNVYNAAVERGLRSFQARHGLAVDGRIGAGTQRSLAVSTEDRARQIALNLERRRWLNRNPNPERIEVNTAAAIMVYIKDNRPVHSSRVVVGDPSNQTPSLERPFASFMANPPWYVPAGIARNEILPRGPAYLAARNMYVQNGQVIQRAGPTAALGYVKFELRDSYAIFLHDTPAKDVFNMAMRQRSHGCVRVQGAIDFARLLLSPDPARLAEFNEALETKETKRIQAGREIDVRLLYWTAFVDGQGRVAFREDVYRRDRRLAEALGIAINLPEPVRDTTGRDETDDGP